MHGALVGFIPYITYSNTRQKRVIKRWNKQQKEWKKMKSKIAKKVGKVYLFAPFFECVTPFLFLHPRVDGAICQAMNLTLAPHLSPVLFVDGCPLFLVPFFRFAPFFAHSHTHQKRNNHASMQTKTERRRSRNNSGGRIPGST